MPRPYVSRLLLQLDACSGFLELRLRLVGLLARHALLHCAGRSVHEILGLLEPEIGERADDFDHLDLLVACAGEHDVERRLLLGRAGTVAGGYCDGSRSGHAPLLLELILELDELEHSHLPKLIDDLLGVSCHSLSLLSIPPRSPLLPRHSLPLLGPRAPRRSRFPPAPRTRLPERLLLPVPAPRPRRSRLAPAAG